MARAESAHKMRKRYKLKIKWQTYSFRAPAGMKKEETKQEPPRAAKLELVKKK